MNDNTVEINKNESESLLLNCTADANPRPTFLWFYNGVVLGNAPRINVSSEIRSAFRDDIRTIPGALGVTTRVNITNLNERDGGVYVCRARNVIDPRPQRDFRVKVIVGKITL